MNAPGLTSAVEVTAVEGTAVELMAPAGWLPLAAGHAARADAMTAAHRARATEGRRIRSRTSCSRTTR